MTPPSTAHPRGSWYRGRKSASRHVRGASPGLAQRGAEHQVNSWREGEGQWERKRRMRGGRGREED